MRQEEELRLKKQQEFNRRSINEKIQKLNNIERIPIKLEDLKLAKQVREWRESAVPAI